MKIKTILPSVLLAVIMCLSPVAAAKDDPYIKVGLAYNSGALAGAKLLNVSGMAEGYSFGYYENNNTFTEIGYCDDRYIIVLKDKTVYMSSNETFSDKLPPNLKKTINPYHLQIDEAFSDYDEALDIANDIRSVGFDAFPAYINGDYVVRIGEYATSPEAKNKRSQVEDAVGYSLTQVGGSATCYTVALTESGRIIFEFDMGGQPFGISPYSENTWFAGYSYCGGFEYYRKDGGDITVINIVRLHDYIKGVISNEMNPAWNIEALKAQALCAKSYSMSSLGKHKSSGFDLCNTTDCQVYYGTRQQTVSSNKAVDDTYGLFIKYKGEVVPAFYHSSSGGYTENAENVWGNEVGYLKGVEDKYLEQTLPYNFTITNSQIKSVLQEKGHNVADITDYYISEYTPFGNVKAVTFTQINGKSLVFSGEKARTIINNSSMGFQTKSQRYTVTPTIGGIYLNGMAFSGALSDLYVIGSSGVSRLELGYNDVRIMTASGPSQLSVEKGGVYQVSGYGSGHNIGMSQWGAKAMADKGFNYQEILEFYYTDIEIGYLN